MGLSIIVSCVYLALAGEVGSTFAAAAPSADSSRQIQYSDESVAGPDVQDHRHVLDHAVVFHQPLGVNLVDQRTMDENIEQLCRPLGLAMNRIQERLLLNMAPGFGRIEGMADVATCARVLRAST